MIRAAQPAVETSAALAEKLEVDRAALAAAERLLDAAQDELVRLRASRGEVASGLLHRSEAGDEAARAELRAFNETIQELEVAIHGRAFDRAVAQERVAATTRDLVWAKRDERDALLADLRARRDVAVNECADHLRVAGALFEKAGECQDMIEKVLNDAGDPPDNRWRFISRMLGALIRQQFDHHAGRYMVDISLAARTSPNDATRILRDFFGG